MGLAFAMAAGGPPGLAGAPGAAGSAGEGGVTGGGVMSPMFVTVALRRIRTDLEHEVEAGALAGPQARDHEAALAADATQLAVGTHEGHPARDVIADPEVAGGETAAVADRDPVARAATGASPSVWSAVFSIGASHPGGPGPLLR